MTEVPMREPTFLILTALAASAQHGYGIMTDVAQISGGRVRLRAGTLYAALNRLAVEGLVEVDREEIVDARLRRYYRLTPSGTERLADEVDRMRRHATVAARRLAVPGSQAYGPARDKGGTGMHDHFRVSDADRDGAAALLRVHFGAGRLTARELDERLTSALSAKTVGDLGRVLAGLPGSADVLLLDEYRERLAGRGERVSMTGPEHPALCFGQTRQSSIRLGDSASLARGYRRLLACYPRWYRRVHEDEMLAVLMTDAPPDKRRPSIAEDADLLLGALRIRCQPSRADGTEPAWRDALAVLSVIVPLIILLTSVAALIELLVILPPPGSTRGPIQRNVPALATPLVLAALVLLALRMRRLAAFGAAGMLIASTLAALRPIAPGLPNETAVLLMTGAYGFLALGMEILALAASPGPRRGLQILTWKHWAFAVIAIVLAAPYVIPMSPPVRLAVTIVICAAMTLTSSLGRWLLLLLAVVAYPTYARVVLDVAYLKPSPAPIAALYLPSLTLAVLAIATARRTSLRQA